MDRKFCLDLTLEDLNDWCRMRSIQAFRAKQIYGWLSSGVTDTDDMTNVPKDVRRMLEEDFEFGKLRVLEKYVSSIDGTTKFVYGLGDGNIIETVVMRYHTGLSVCISSQAGCKMGCAFCASAKAGFGRSLSSGEMLAQVLVSQRNMGEKIRSVVVMGIGEPFDNYDNLLGFIKLITDPGGAGLGARHITVSTCGLVPKIDEFTALHSQVNLAVSLHAPNDDIRLKIMPVAKAYAMDKLMAACQRYTKKTGRRITFEYSLFKDVNDSIKCAEELASKLKGMLCHVNLIAANEFPGSEFKRSPQSKVAAFKKRLEDLGINATLRREMGTDIMAACGQLRRGKLDSPEGSDD